MRLLLINPKYPESFWSFRWAVDEVLPAKRAINPPLGLATLAALCPRHWQVSIVDENVESIPLEPLADIVGVCGMGVQFERQKALLAYYRSRGHYVLAGGSFASLVPERYTELADTVVAGEAEYIWKRFCADFEHGMPAAHYRETGVVELADSPTPRFELLKLDRYTTATLQFSRGCPYRCEFCDIIVMFGRKPRHKSVEQVGRELDALRALGARNVFFVDDNLIGHRAVAKELLRFLIAYQRRHGRCFQFGTEVSLNLAQDRELLQLFREAGFGWLFIGIESPDPATLKAALKTQNLHEDVLTSVRRIYSYGIDVLAGFIVGFDNDSAETFDLQYRFIMASGIQAAMVGLLTALPHTPLYERLRKSGRLIGDADASDNTGARTNIVPLRMSYEQMIDAYERLYARLLSDHGIAERVRNKLRHLGAPVQTGEYAVSQQLGIAARLLLKGVLPGGPARLWHFVRSMPWTAPRKVPLALVDWIAGLSMRRYVERRLRPRLGDAGASARLAASVRNAMRSYVASGKVSMSFSHAAVPSLAIALHGALDRRFFKCAAPMLERLLKRTPARVTLRIEALQREHSQHLTRMLQRLARYGDRVSIMLDDKLRRIVPVDSSVFDLVLLRDYPSSQP